MEESKETHDYELEKLKLKYSFLKFFLGTFAIGILSLGINWQIQEKKLQFEIQTKENDYIAQFLDHGLDKELENRRDFAAYFVRLSPTVDARGRWKLYLDFVEELIVKARNRERDITVNDAKLKIAAEEVALAQQQAAEAQAKLLKLSISNSNKEEVEQLKKQISLSSEEAESSRKQLQKIQETLVNTRQDLSSIRSQPLDIESNYPLSADNVAKDSESKSNYWEWTIFINAPEDVLEKIEYVEYTLHPTFLNPVRIVNQRSSGDYAFPLTTSGWGTFTVKIKVFYKDGTYQRLAHTLVFN